MHKIPHQMYKCDETDKKAEAGVGRNPAIDSGAKNAFNNLKLSSTHALWRAPYSNSALTILHKVMLDGESDRICFATVALPPLRKCMQVL